MIMLVIFWIVAAVSLALYLISLKYKKAEVALPPLLLLAGSFLIVGIITKDPLFSSLGVPVEFEWVVGLFITGLSSWKLYFSPLKERVIKTENELSSMKSDISSIKDDTNLIKEKIINGKVKKEYKRVR